MRGDIIRPLILGFLQGFYPEVVLHGKMSRYEDVKVLELLTRYNVLTRGVYGYGMYERAGKENGSGNRRIGDGKDEWSRGLSQGSQRSLGRGKMKPDLRL